MALLHSRVRRVFYRYSNKKAGGFESNFRIHCEKDLNHHFDVFKTEVNQSVNVK